MKRPVFKILTSAILLLVSSMPLSAEEPVYDLAKFSSAPFHYQVMARDIYNATFDHTRNDFKKRYIRSTDYYFATGLELGRWAGVQYTLGTHQKCLNAEFFVTQITNSFVSPYIIWSGTSEEFHRSYTAYYKPSYSLGAKFGYGFALGERFKLTPQFGLRFVKIKEEIADNSISFVKGARCVSPTLGGRIYFGIFQHLGISLSQEILIPTYRSNAFRFVNGINSDLSKNSYGYNASLAISVTL